MAQQNRVLVPLAGKISEVRELLINDNPLDYKTRTSPTARSRPTEITSGRAAALSVVNEESEEMLFRLVMAGSTNRIPGQPLVAGIVSSELEEEIELLGFDFLFLSPGCVHESLVRSSPDVIVIQRSQFHAGPWYGAESTTGTKLAGQVIAMSDYAIKQQIPCYFLDSPIAKDCNSRSLSQRATLVFTPEPLQFDEIEGANSSRIFRLLIDFADKGGL
jgi:hypothetical protein